MRHVYCVCCKIPSFNVKAGGTYSYHGDLRVNKDMGQSVEQRRPDSSPDGRIRRILFVLKYN
jgi:hypothetical protein